MILQILIDKARSLGKAYASGAKAYEENNNYNKKLMK